MKSSPVRGSTIRALAPTAPAFALAVTLALASALAARVGWRSVRDRTTVSVRSSSSSVMHWASTSRSPKASRSAFRPTKILPLYEVAPIDSRWPADSGTTG